VVVLKRPAVPGWGVPHVQPDEEDDDDGPFQEDNYGFEISHSVSFNGILCLESEFYGERRVVLWNPTTNEFKLLPLPENNPSWYILADHYQIGYDHVKDDYKMIRYTRYSPKINPYKHVPSEHFWEMYSLSSNSWKKINVNMPPSYWTRQQVYLDGVSHRWDKTETNTYLVPFDFCKESFITTPIPSYVYDSLDFPLVRRRLMVLNGSIAFMVHDTEASTFHISILGELGVKESWTKLFIVGPLPCLDHLIGARKKGNTLFRKKDSQLAWFDLSTRMIDEIGVTTERFYCKILFHKESLLPIGGIYTNFPSCFHPQDI